MKINRPLLICWLCLRWFESSSAHHLIPQGIATIHRLRRPAHKTQPVQFLCTFRRHHTPPVHLNTAKFARSETIRSRSRNRSASLASKSSHSILHHFPSRLRLTSSHGTHSVFGSFRTARASCKSCSSSSRSSSASRSSLYSASSSASFSVSGRIRICCINVAALISSS